MKRPGDTGDLRDTGGTGGTGGAGGSGGSGGSGGTDGTGGSGRGGGRLERLDRAVVPVAAAAVGSAVDRTRALGSRVGSSAAALGAARGRRSVPPRVARSLVPAAVGALAVASIVVLVTRDVGTPQPAPAGFSPPATAAPLVPADVTAQVGPAPGTPLDVYAAAAQERIRAYALAVPAQDTYAVASFTTYRRPADLAGPARRYRLTEVLYRVPPGGSPLLATVRDPLADVPAAFARSASGEAAAGHPVAAAALRGSCACVYAMVVRTTAGDLTGLAQASGVRMVDAAEPGTVSATTRFVGVYPEAR